MKLIGVSGKAGAGKDASVKALSEHFQNLGMITTEVKFAYPIKTMCVDMYGWDLQRLIEDADYKEGDTLDDGSPDPACEMLGLNRRQVMQKIGTEAFRDSIHLDHWIIVTKLAMMRGAYDGIDIGFISDCRFFNEMNFVRGENGLLLRVNRVGSSDTSTSHSDHASETEWQQWTDWDAVVENDVRDDRSKNTNYRNLQKSLVQAVTSVWDYQSMEKAA